MKRTLLCLVFALLALSAVSFPADAATVDFQGVCTPISYACDFDTARGSGTSCAPFAISSYSWSFTNNAATASGSFASHVFASNAGGTASVTVTCSNGSTVNKTRNVCFAVGVPGCINPAATCWN